MTTLTKSWSVFSYYNFMLTTHPCDINFDYDWVELIYGMDMDLGSIISSQISQPMRINYRMLGFPALISNLCCSQGVGHVSLVLKSLGKVLDLGYFKRYCEVLVDIVIVLPDVPTRCRNRNVVAKAVSFSQARARARAFVAPQHFTSEAVSLGQCSLFTCLASPF